MGLQEGILLWQKMVDSDWIMQREFHISVPPGTQSFSLVEIFSQSQPTQTAIQQRSKFSCCTAYLVIPAETPKLNCSRVLTVK